MLGPVAAARHRLRFQPTSDGGDCLFLAIGAALEMRVFFCEAGAGLLAFK